MSFGLPSLKIKPEVAPAMGLQEGAYEVPNLMTAGFTSVKSNLEQGHPLLVSEKNYYKNREDLNMAMMRNTQGLHAPLRFQMECNSAKKIGHLPFLPSSNLMLDVITGRDIDIGPEDVFNTSEFRETAGQPHAITEKSLGIL
ncbi:proteasome maturation protein ump1 [Holotrichia oblita]|uniref:Proteasome maturation protein ump1 n=1 Tax=Holotrichia oblita TaxID=644536 RepID=A0ACB9T6S9_HOLOL|nr:proteasome maturation protein ump1 [Holotrichia oblita]